MPFQFSVHYIDEDGVLTHTAYLAEGDVHPGREFAQELIAAIDRTDVPVVVYNESFELGVLGAEQELTQTTIGKGWCEHEHEHEHEHEYEHAHAHATRRCTYIVHVMTRVWCTRGTHVVACLLSACPSGVGVPPARCAANEY